MALKENDTSTIERVKTDVITFEPDMYKVILVNDDVTPQNFVVAVLTEIFGHEESIAEKIMLDVHKTGAGTAGIYIEDVAITKANMTITAAREYGYPLKVTVEKETL
jgi:ATP-dependent Clp protease adaptor protein ClpS